MKTNKTKNNLTENADEIRQRTMQILAGDQFTSALPYAQQWTKLCPRESMSWTALSIALYGLNRHAEARKALDKVAEIDAAIALVMGWRHLQANTPPARFILALLQRERESTARGLKKQ